MTLKARKDVEGPPRFEPALAPAELLDRALGLCALSPAVQQLLALARRDDAPLEALVAKLAESPTLAAAVLRAANSPSYGRPRQVADLTRAVSLLGLRVVHDLVASTAMLAALGRRDALSQRLQASSTLSAHLACKLARKLGGPPELAYLGGLLCELGALACVALDRSFTELYWSTHGDARRRFAEERLRYGRATPELAGAILEASALPSHLADPVSETGLEPSDEGTPLGRVIGLSRLCATALLSASEHGEPDVLWADLSTALAAVGVERLNPEQLFRYSLAAARRADLKLGAKFEALNAKRTSRRVPPTSRPQPPPARPSKRAPHAYALLGTGLTVAGVLLWLLSS